MSCGGGDDGDDGWSPKHPKTSCFNLSLCDLLDCNSGQLEQMDRQEGFEAQRRTAKMQL
jgi:hypothetical protein